MARSRRCLNYLRRCRSSPLLIALLFCQPSISGPPCAGCSFRRARCLALRRYHNVSKQMHLICLVETPTRPMFVRRSPPVAGL